MRPTGFAIGSSAGRIARPKAAARVVAQGICGYYGNKLRSRISDPCTGDTVVGFEVEKDRPSLAELKRLRSMAEIHFADVEEPRTVVCSVEEEGSCMHGALPWERRKDVGCKAR